MSSSKKRGSVSGDAFALLMGSSSKKKPPSRKHGTRFVPCPAGCGQSLLEKDVNRHLDQCLVTSGGEEEEDSDAMVRRVTQPEQQPSLLVKSSSCMVVSQSTPNAEDSSQKTLGGRVLCPVCAKSFPKAFLNLHLDQCTQKEHQQPKSKEGQQVGCPQNESPAVNKSKEPKKHHRNDRVKDSCDSMGITDEAGIVESHLDWSTDTRLEPCDDNNFMTPYLLEKRQEIEVDNGQTKETITVTEGTALQPKPTSMSESAKPNVFATMMKQSKTAFANAQNPTNSGTSATVRQTFHLLNYDNSSVALVLRNTPPPPPEFEWNCCWSANVIVKDKFARNSSVAENNRPTGDLMAFDVTLSSSIPSHGTNSTDQPVRWVRHHSRLSVPVLKSILQKAVRRRRPLPAVRVAMELADKALGELLRRLPIIVLEDSTLHPDLDFLVWIMMAHSKDFAPPPRLLVRVFQIVFEVASCQWSDHLRSDSKAVPDPAADPVTTLTSLYYDKTNRSDSNSSSHTVESSLLWSMLVRAEYGGIRGDVQMFHQFAQLWSHRFFASTSEQSTTVPTAVASRISTNTSKNENDAEAPTCQWSDVPKRIHQRAKEQSVQRVTVLCSSGIERLTMEDVCVEGVDFHCSRVLDELLADAELCGMCLDLLILANGNDTVPVSAEGRRSYLERIWKDCMWKYSSGVNRRRPLVVVSSASLSESKPNDDDDGEQYSELWNDLVAPKALAYQRHYVKQRLASSDYN